MNIIKLLVASYLILSTFIEWNIIHCMEEKESSYDIGARYYEGIGAEPDKVEAAKWFRRAAEEDGHVTAQFRLAICYELGDGVNQDKAEFAKWLQKAAEQEHIIAQFRTGVCYEKGEGVIQDKAEALKWFQKAAEQGNLPAKQRVIKLESELFGYSSTADQLNSPHKPNANMSKTQAGTTNKKFADKGNFINNTNPISSQSHKKHPRQNNQKQNSQNNLSPEEYKKAEEAARKAMDELIAEEEAELRKRKQPRGNSKKVKGKGNEGIKKEEKKEPISTKQITSLKKATEKPSGDKPAQVSTTKISAVDKPSSVTPSLQTQKQVNASKGKQKGQRDNTAQTVQAVNNNPILVSSVKQNEATNTVGKEGKEKNEGAREPAQTTQVTDLKKAIEKPTGNKLDQKSNTKISAVDKPSPITHSPQKQKQNNAPKGKQDGQSGNTVQTTQAINNNRIFSYREKEIKPINNVGKQKAICNNSTADTNEGEKKAIIDIDAHQLLQVDNQPGSINDHQLKPDKKKSPKTLWSDVKVILKKKKNEKEEEAEKEIKAENNIITMSSPILYPTIVNPNAHRNGETGKTSYYAGQIRYIQVPVPFPVHIRIPVYIPVPSSFPHVSGNMSQPWIPHTQIKYEDGKKIVTQWSDEGSGSIHIYHPDSGNMELEYSCLNTHLRHLKSILKMQNSQIEDKDQCDKTDSSSPHIIHHGGEAAKQNNEELKKEICKLEKIIQEKNLELPK